MYAALIEPVQGREIGWDLLLLLRAFHVLSSACYRSSAGKPGKSAKGK